MRIGRSTALAVAPLVLLAGFAFGMARRHSWRAFASPPAAIEDRHTPRLVPSRHLPLPRDVTPAVTASQSNDPVRFVSAAMTDSAAAEDSLEAVIVEVRMGRLASRTVQAYRQRTEALIPVTEVLQLGEVAYRLTPEGRLEAVVNPGGRRLVIDAHRDTMVLGDRRVRIEPEFLVVRDGLLYVGAERLGDLFGTPILVDWTELTVSIVDPTVFPAGLRAQRQAAREAFLRRAELQRADLTLPATRRRLDGLVLDYSFLAPSDAPVQGATYTATLGADLFGGSLELGVSSLGPVRSGAARLEGSWTGVWEERPWLRQLRIGDGVTTGPNLRQIRGVSISNAPFVRPSLIGSQRYSGELAPGWSVEAYRGGELVSVDSADAAGHYAIELPVRYGENPVDFVAYGPLGELRQFNRTYRVLTELLPAKRFEYGVSGGSCLTPQCRSTANLDLRYGGGDRWTVQAGYERYWRDSLGDLSHPYVGVTTNPTNAWAVDAMAVQGAFATGQVRFEPTVDLRLTGGYTRFATGTRAPILTIAGRTAQWNIDAFVRPMPSAGYFFFDGAVQPTLTTAGAETQARLGASVQTAELRLLPEVRMRWTPGQPAQSVVALSAYVLPQPTWGPVLGSVWLRGALSEEMNGPARLASFEAFAGRPLWPGVRLEVGTSWTRGSPGVTYHFFLTSYLSVFRSVTAVDAQTGGDATGTQFVQGSLLWDRATGRVRTAPGPSLERAGVAGRVFLDQNGNGRLDPGEPLLPGVRVQVGTRSAAADSNGVFRVWDVVPFETILVSVDSLSLESPLTVPAYGSVSIVPGPNRFTLLDVAIVQAGVVEGRVVADGHGVPGVGLALVDRRSGARRTFTTFSDGGFYVLGVKPGDYDLTVDPRALEVLGMDAVPVRLTLTPTATGVGASGVEVPLRPRR